MGDVGSQANEPHKATLSFPGGTAEFPILPAVDGNASLDVSTLTKQTGLTALDYARRKLSRLRANPPVRHRSPSLDENDQLQLAPDEQAGGSRLSASRAGSSRRSRSS